MSNEADGSLNAHSTTTSNGIVLRAIGHVESLLRDPSLAPKQGVEGAPSAWLEFVPDVASGLRDLVVGDEVLVLTWLDRADRSTLEVHPRDDPKRGAARGVQHGTREALPTWPPVPSFHRACELSSDFRCR